MEDWKERKARLKEKFSKFHEANAQRLEYEQEQLITRLEKRLGASRETILKLLSEL
jgi:hypothetical protein